MRKQFMLRVVISEALSNLGGSFQPDPNSITIIGVANAAAAAAADTGSSSPKVRVKFAVMLRAKQSSQAAVTQMQQPQFAQGLAEALMKHGVLAKGTEIEAAELQLAAPIAQAAKNGRGETPVTGTVGESERGGKEGGDGNSGGSSGMWIAPVVLGVGGIAAMMGSAFVKRYELGKSTSQRAQVASTSNIIKDPDFDEEGETWHDEAPTNERTSLVKGREKPAAANIL
jgi:hypothetical protein